MTVLADYTPITIPITDRYVFNFETIGVEPIEVFEVDDAFAKFPVSPQDYTIELKGFRPQFTGGTITFNRPHGSSIVSVVIERNTLITQTVDFKRVGRFNPDLIEFTLDKHTMIFQEINARKCVDPLGSPLTTLITQEIDFVPYGVFTAASLQFALDKLTTIAVEMEANKTDCRDRPEDT